MENLSDANIIRIRSVIVTCFVLLTLVAGSWPHPAGAYQVTGGHAQGNEANEFLETKTICLGDTGICREVGRSSSERKMMTCIAVGRGDPGRCEATVTETSWQKVHIEFYAEIKFLPCVRTRYSWDAKLLAPVCSGMELGESGFLFVERPYEGACGIDESQTRTAFLRAAHGGGDAPSFNPNADDGETIRNQIVNLFELGYIQEGVFPTNGESWKQESNWRMNRRFEVLFLGDNEFEERYPAWYANHWGHYDEMTGGMSVGRSVSTDPESGEFGSGALAHFTEMREKQNAVVQEINEVIAAFPDFVVKEKIVDTGGDCRILR